MIKERVEIMRQKIRKALQTISMLFFPLTFVFFSPYVSLMGASLGIINGSAFIFMAMLITSMICSRLFCGWLCPAGRIQDILIESQGRKWNSRLQNLSRYIIWLVWVSIVLGQYVMHLPLKSDFLYSASLDPQLLIIYFVVISIIYLFALLTGKRGMCHSICWMAPFMTIGGKLADVLRIPRFRIVGDAKQCVSCMQCNKKCPMGVDVEGYVQSKAKESDECIGCYECVDTCPRKAIRAGLFIK
jgi:polyferredoxin